MYAPKISQTWLPNHLLLSLTSTVHTCPSVLPSLVKCACVQNRFSRVQLFATPWTVARQGPLSMEFSRQEYWSGQPSPSPQIFPAQESNSGLLYCRQILYCLSSQGSLLILSKAEIKSYRSQNLFVTTSWLLGLNRSLKRHLGTSLVVQHLKIHHAMQGTQTRSPV